jgi:pimeloyl-ACP methyl ester carboxylesterase
MRKKLFIGCGVLLLIPAVAVAAVFYLAFARVDGAVFDSDGVPIHYTAEGEGEPLILIHGFAANADINWRRPGITGLLANHFRVVSFDCRGHGLSGKPESQDAYGLELIEDVVRLMDHLDIEKAHVAGYSMGGFIALGLVTAHPDRVRSAAFCASGWRHPEDRSDMPEPYRPPPEDAVRRARQAALIPGFGSREKSLQDRIRNWFGDRMKMNKNALKACKKTFFELNISRGDLEKNTVPCILFIGDHDGLLPYANNLRTVMANLEFVLIDGPNHFTTPLNRAFRRKLLDFFVRHRADAGKE